MADHFFYFFAKKLSCRDIPFDNRAFLVDCKARHGEVIKKSVVPIEIGIVDLRQFLEIVFEIVDFSKGMAELNSGGQFFVG